MVPSGVFYSRLPERVAVHFNAAGQADGFAPRWFAAFGLPLLLLLVNVFVHLRLNHDPQRQNASAVLAQAGRWIAPLASVVTEAVLLIHALRGPGELPSVFLPSGGGAGDGGGQLPAQMPAE